MASPSPVSFVYGDGFAIGRLPNRVCGVGTSVGSKWELFEKCMSVVVMQQSNKKYCRFFCLIVVTTKNMYFSKMFVLVVPDRWENAPIFYLFSIKKYMGKLNFPEKWSIKALSWIFSFFGAQRWTFFQQSCQLSVSELLHFWKFKTQTIFMFYSQKHFWELKAEYFFKQVVNFLFLNCISLANLKICTAFIVYSQKKRSLQIWLSTTSIFSMVFEHKSQFCRGHVFKSHQNSENCNGLWTLQIWL